MKNNHTIQDFTVLANQIKKSYDEINLQSDNKKWGYLEFAQGMVGDVGDLTKLLMAKNKLRSYHGIEINDEIKHELCDILWSVLIISKELDVNLQEIFPDFVEKLNSKLRNQISKPN